MRFDIGELTGLIVISSGAVVLGLSYLAAYLMGKNQARKEIERRDTVSPMRQPDRIDRLESAVDSIALQVERLGEGQRFLLGTRSPERPATPSPKPERRHATPV